MASYDTALFVGGTRFIGRHTVEAFLEAGYEVTTVTRGQHADPFADREGVTNRTGDRTLGEDLEAARDAVEPDVVVDFVGLHPGEVREATDVFADARYVFVSSGSAYVPEDVPMREGATDLHPCEPEQEDDDGAETYGPRKAECDRAVFAAAERGIEAMAVRPMLVQGPHDYTERFGYWVNRVAEHDEVLVPGDGGSLLHRVYVEDLARALLLVAEEGEPGEAYNAADRSAYSLDRSLELIADGLDTDVTPVHASERELAAHGVEPGAFPLYTPSPMLASTGKLAALGWESTPPAEYVAETARVHVDAGVTGPKEAPDREATEAVIAALHDERGGGDE
ncbi:NAD-dependent epimerase/dehydratase family protein [Halobaculum sp. WSA2]|uniref:NAD-dependent epimerase/dehydratase family protein n=1 Tax=Halobaculum saliterrae TaxID=2073113 RepID=A0A6B0SQZ7_9EURY|nr:NAD-dependent epimerase/dehydratase family protein [Halobaculum saliterrae]MXR41075.1 NAD-dependent epimerase/dehydratase family protein [Halobaculum saliterrae]